MFEETIGLLESAHELLQEDKLDEGVEQLKKANEVFTIELSNIKGNYV